MDLSSELTGLPLQVKEAPALKVPRKDPAAETEPCPKCFKPNAKHARECLHCGILIAKAKVASLDFVDPLPARSPNLENAWKKVVDDYSVEQLHMDFIRTAQIERNLPYAAAQYGQMAKLMPTDEITKKRVAEIQAMAQIMVPEKQATPHRQRMYPRLWQIPLLGAAILIIVGLTLPMFRNIVGLGAAFLFLGIAMQMQLRRKD